MNVINLLVTLDKNYIPPLQIMLKSLFFNNTNESFHIYMIYDGISPLEISRLDAYCSFHGSKLFSIPADENAFSRAPVLRYYSKAMYYRLLASQLLPETLERALYLDPDTLIINPVRGLYELDLSGYLFAGAMHSGIIGISEHVNKIRLGTYETGGYYNSGVLLMNLALQRKLIREEDVYSYAEENQNKLLLPDQDILNGLYGSQILPLDESLFNYDVRRYESYRMLAAGEKDMDWVMKNTVILHFCGKAKPWNKDFRGRFGILFKHYAALADRTLREI